MLFQQRFGSKPWASGKDERCQQQECAEFPHATESPTDA
jgi:hypothetical protein